MAADHRCFVWLEIRSLAMTASEIGLALGVGADRSWSVGDKRGSSIRVYRDNGFVIESGLPLVEELDDHVGSLLRRLVPLAACLKGLADQVTIGFRCALYRERVPALNFPPDLLGLLGGIGASLDVDLYVGG